MIRVLLADDQSMVLAGLRTILEAEGDIQVVADARTGEEAIDMARRHSPDLVLMDIRMPGMDGIAATRQLSDTEAKVVILTTFDLDEYVYEALLAGAAGFLVKDIPDDQLISGVRAAASGESLLAPSVTRRLIESYTRRPPKAALPSGPNELTPREIEVWKLMAQGLSNAEIATELIVGEATVKTHIARILAKLGVRDRVQAVVTAYQSGIL